MDEDVVSSKGPRSDTPPVRGMREGGLGPIQQPNSSSGSSNQTPPPVGTQVGGQGGGSHHHQPYMGSRNNYSNFPDQGSRMASHQQQQQTQRGSGAAFCHQDEGHHVGQQQGQIWGAPHPHYDRNGRADLSPLESNNPHHPQHQQQQHGHQQHHSPFSFQAHVPDNGRERVTEAPKKSDPSPPLQQPSLSSSCSSSSSSSREDGGKALPHHLPPQSEAGSGQRADIGSVRETKQQDKAVQGHTQPSVMSQQPQPQRLVQEPQHHRDPKSNQRERGARDHPTDTKWGPRPGSGSAGPPSSHSRRATGGNNREDPPNHASASDHNKPSVGSQSGGGNGNKRAGPIKRPVLKEIKREGGEGEGVEKMSGGGSGKDERQDAGHSSVKQEISSGPQSSAVSGKDEPAQTGPKSRNGGKDRVSNERGGATKGTKDMDNPNPSSGYSGPSSNRRDRERSFEGWGGVSYHAVSGRGNRASRGRGGEFYGRGRGYRGTYTGTAGAANVSRGRAASGRSSRDARSGGGYQQEFTDENSGGRRGRGGLHANPGRARNRSETRSEGSEYEEVPKRRRQRGSETGSESAASDLAQSDKEERKSSTKNGNGADSHNGGGGIGSTPARGSQARVFTPRGVPSRRGRGGGGGSGGLYRGGGAMAGPHRSTSRAEPHGWASKSSTSVRKQQVPAPSSLPRDSGRGTGGDKKEKAPDGSQVQNLGGANPPQSTPAASAPGPQGCLENGGVGAQPATTHTTTNTGGPLPLPLGGPDGRGFPRIARDGFERPPRRRRHGRSQHQQDKPPRFRRLKERENAARINGGVGVIGGGRPSSPGQNSVQDVTDGVPNAPPSTGVPNANHVTTANTTTNNSAVSNPGSTNSNIHHHHHYNQGNSQHHHSHNPPGGAKSPDFSNQNSDQANEEWETASESSDFTEFRERDGGGKSYSSHPHHHPPGRGGGGAGEREMTAKEQAANKRSFSSQRPGMERQNRRVNPGGREGGGGGGGGGRGPRGPPGGGGGGAGSGGSNRGERRGNWPSPKTRK
ncbi:hypothetical protein UPYG_G00340760 [Umbra pygmaea]|uniref:Uncharacterized protein n=1 Tax=Umbra pygmaea TaxID=75934 RepID=A0ABD0W1A8_UMBPY